MISQLLKFIRILSSETEPAQISAGLALAMIIGFTPLFSLHNVLVILVLLMFRVNLAAFLMGWAFYTAFAYLLDPLFHMIGQTILTYHNMLPVWTELYNSAFWRLTEFNNTLVMGSLVVSLLAFVPMLLLGNLLIRHYRTDVLSYLDRSAFFKFARSSKVLSKFISLAE